MKKHKMSKPVATTVFVICSGMAVIIMVMSMGWFFMMSSVVLIPFTIFHFIVGTRAVKRNPALNALVLVSGFIFLLFSLVRPDGDDLNAYTGYSSLIYNLGMAQKQYTEPWTYMFELAFGILLGLLVLDIWIFNQSRKRPPAVNPKDIA